MLLPLIASLPYQTNSLTTSSNTLTSILRPLLPSRNVFVTGSKSTSIAKSASVHLDSSASLQLFASGRPSIGRHVRSLKFENKGTFKVGLHQLFHHLPNLVKLDIPCLPALFPSTNLPETPAPYLRRLKCIATSFPHEGDSGAVDLDVLAQLATLPAL